MGCFDELCLRSGESLDLALRNPGQPSVALVIVRSAHNDSLKWEVHAVNFKTNEVRPDCFASLGLAKTIGCGEEGFAPPRPAMII